MKTYIIQLESDDDILSACDKMRWSKGGRILLVWPEKERMLNRRLDLVLLQRQSLELGAKLAFVSRDPEIRYYAPRLGIPLFKKLRKAQRAPWRVPRRYQKEQQKADEAPGPGYPPSGADGETTPRLLPERPPRPSMPHPAIRVVAFTMGVLAFLSIAAVLFPSAEISLIPVHTIQESKISVYAHPDISQASISGDIPARWKTVTVEGRGSIPASSSIDVPTRMATGNVEFTNLTDQSISIPVGTVVRTDGSDGMRFQVTKSGQISPGTGNNITLPIRCLTAGAIGNLPAHQIVAIEGNLGTQVSVTNPFPTRNGSDNQAPIPTEEDREQLFATLKKSLERTALQELTSALEANDLIIPDSLQIVSILEENYQPAEDQPADHLELNLRLEFQALFISNQDLVQLAQMVLDSNLPAGFMKTSDTVDLEQITIPMLDDNGNLRWSIQAKREIQAIVKEPQAIQIVLGQTPQNAQYMLKTYLPIEAPIQMRLSPEWWPRLPILPFRILVRYADSESMAQHSGDVSTTP